MIKERKKLEPVVVFLFVSALIHLSFCVSLLFTKPDERPAIQEVEITYDNPTPSHLQLLKQIVEQKDRINDEKDEKAKYLSAHDQKVVKETRAQNSGQFNNTVAGGSSGQPQQEKKQAHKQAKKSQEKGELPSLKDLSPKFSRLPIWPNNPLLKLAKRRAPMTTSKTLPKVCRRSSVRANLFTTRITRASKRRSANTGSPLFAKK